MSEPKPNQLRVTFDRNGVAAPAHQATKLAFEVVASCLMALAGRELGNPKLPNAFIQHGFGGPELSSDERHALYESWLFAKAFQDIVRGVRATLEEAAHYLGMLAWRPTQVTRKEFEDGVQRLKKHANGLSLPDLLGEVNPGLVEPLEFEAHFRSIQKARNCFEHRHGIVGVQDVNEGETSLTLTFPRLKLFYMRHGEEIEVHRDHRVDAQDGEPEVDILGRIETRAISYKLSERITFTATDFGDIAMACHFFASEVARKLPTIDQT